MKNKKIFLFAIFMFTIMLFTNVYADNCTQFEIIDGGFPIHSVTVNGQAWASVDDKYDPNGGNYTLVILAGKKGNEFPELSTPGGVGTLESVKNPDATGNNDDYKFTYTITNHNNGECSFIGGLEFHSGPEPKAETHEETASVTITIKGEELEYHYVEDKPDEADVTYFKFDINGGTEEERLVPFTFGNAEYTHNDNEPPKNVTQVTTKQPISYKYQYDGSGKVTFCVNGGGTDEYTSIKINDVEYAGFAPHTKEKYWEALNGWAQMFCIPDVSYSPSYNVVVEGRNTADENKIPGFGWSYLSSERSANVTEENEGNFAHGRLEFVSASLVIDGEEKTFSSARAFDDYRYKGTGQIFQWGDGQKDYPEEDRRMAWGEAQMPYGTTLRVRIVPDEGYQLTGLAVNENGFKATEIPGEYELTLTRTNLSYNEDNNQFDLNPRFEKVDATASSESKNVSNVTLTIKGRDNAFETGTPKLEVTDVASMSPERESEFDKATEEGYEINNYLEISLYNTIYKGGKKTGNKLDSWDTEVHELQGKATIDLELGEDLGGNEVAVIHEVRDADNKIVGYDVLDAEYDREKNTVTFETDGFSTYAIAVKPSDEKEENNNEENDEVTVEFDSRGGTQLSPVRLHKGDKLEKPEDPENGEHKFLGWFIDGALEEEFDFNEPVEKDIILYASWSDDDRNTNYTVSDDGGNTIQFKEVPDRKYNLTIKNFIGATDEELAEEGVTRELYNEVLSGLKEVTKDYGTLLMFYDIRVTDKEDGHEITDGPLTIKIKLTEEMKKYNSFVLACVKDDFSLEKPIELKIEGDYLVGTLPHLSNYVLVGDIVSEANADVVDTDTTSNTEVSNPKTNDSIYSWIIVMLASIVGLAVLTLVIKRKKSYVK